MVTKGESNTVFYYLDCQTNKQKKNILKLTFKLFYVTYLCLATKLQTKRFQFKVKVYFIVGNWSPHQLGDGENRNTWSKPIQTRGGNI